MPAYIGPSSSRRNRGGKPSTMPGNGRSNGQPNMPPSHRPDGTPGAGCSQNARPIGLGTVAPGGAGSSTLTFTCDKPLRGLCDLVLSDTGNIVTRIDSVTVDSETVYIGNGGIPGSVLRDNNLARLPFKWGRLNRADRTIVIVATVSAAGTWGATALADRG